MIKKAKLISYSFFYLIILFFNTNCTQKVTFNSLSQSSLNTEPSQNTGPEIVNPIVDIQIIDGKKLYESNCALCHGTLVVSNRIGKTEDDIRNAIQNIPSMQSLSHLTNEEIAQIAIALKPSTAPTNPNSGVTIRLVISNRYQLASQLKQFFVKTTNPTANDLKIQTVIDNLIFNHPEGFGGNCNRNDPACLPSACGNDSTCKGNLNIRQNSEIIPSASAIRKGFLIQACEQILSFDNSITNIASQTGIDINSQPDSLAINKLANFIYRNHTLDSSSVNGLTNLSTKIKSLGLNNLDQWRMLLLALCQSSSAELL